MAELAHATAPVVVMIPATHIAGSTIGSIIAVNVATHIVAHINVAVFHISFTHPTLLSEISRKPAQMISVYNSKASYSIVPFWSHKSFELIPLQNPSTESCISSFTLSIKVSTQLL